MPQQCKDFLPGNGLFAVALAVLPTSNHHAAFQSAHDASAPSLLQDMLYLSAMEALRLMRWVRFMHGNRETKSSLAAEVTHAVEAD